MASQNRFLRVALVGVLFILIGLAMDLLDLHSTLARTLFFTMFLIGIAAVARTPRPRR